MSELISFPTPPEDVEEPDAVTQRHIDAVLRWRYYERLVVATWGSTPGHAMDDPTQRGIHLACAIMSEAGEAGELIKKAHRITDDCRTVDRRALLKELGDVLWAVTSAAVWAGASLDDVRELNITKMYERHGELLDRVMAAGRGGC